MKLYREHTSLQPLAPHDIKQYFIMSWKSRSRATEIIGNWMLIWLYSTQWNSFTNSQMCRALVWVHREVNRSLWELFLHAWLPTMSWTWSNTSQHILSSISRIFPITQLPLAVHLGLFMHSQNFLVLIIMYRLYLGTCYISMHMQGIIDAYMHIRA